MKKIWIILVFMISAHAGCLKTSCSQSLEAKTIIVSGLEWTPDTVQLMTWSKAENYVKTLSIGGHNDWRLPTREELTNLHYKAQKTSKIAKEFRISHGGGVVWTSEPCTCMGNETRWGIYFESLERDDIPTMYGCGEISGIYYSRPPGRVAYVFAVRLTK